MHPRRTPPAEDELFGWFTRGTGPPSRCALRIAISSRFANGCRGRHPHLQAYRPCDQPLKLMVLGASNLWFAVTASALHLPQGDPVAETFAEHWDVLSAQPSPEVLAAIVAGMPALHALRELTPVALAAAVEAERTRRAARRRDAPRPGLLDAEWELFRHPTTTRHDADFRAVPTPTPADR